MIRHKTFSDKTTLKTFLGNTAPSDVYYSSAYYESPTRSMEKKSWKGSDLVFDIDADHIPTSCHKTHDSWICKNCDFSGKGRSPSKCPTCGGGKFGTETWICESCLESVKAETSKLGEMLSDDLGFADQEIQVYFSGNRGYHLHVECEEVHNLDSLARKEVVDYIIGLGLKAELHGVITRERVGERGFSGIGWRRRVSTGILEIMENATRADTDSMGLSRSSADYLINNREKLLESFKNTGWLGVKGVTARSWKKIADKAVDRQSSKIDTVVTTDVHRLIRLAGSLHGKTGLMKTATSLKGLEGFDPLKEAVAFKEGQMAVQVLRAPEFRIGDTSHGPFTEPTRAELPVAAAIFLLCKGAAQVVE